MVTARPVNLESSPQARRPPTPFLKSGVGSPARGEDGVRGADPSTTAEAPERRLRDLTEAPGPVRIIGRVIVAERRDVARKDDGTKRPVLSGLLTDGSATLRFTWWDPPMMELEKGTVLRVASPQVRVWQGRKELSFGWRTAVELASELELPRMEDHEFLARTLGELKPGEEGFRVVVRVLDIGPRTLTVGSTERVVQSGLLADGTGRAGFTCWTDVGLRAGGVYELFGAYVRTFQGEPQLVLDERSRARALPETTLPGVPRLEEQLPAEIGRLEERGGGAYQVVEGIVLEVREPSGLVLRCPVCDRTLSKGTCRKDGTVAGEAELRARLVLDDGTGSLTAQLPRGVVERLLGRTLPQCVEWARERLDPGVVQEALRERVLGRRLRAVGRAVPGDWGLTLFVDRELIVPTDASHEAKRLLEKLALSEGGGA